MTTGRDLEGRFLPFFVRSLNVYTSGAYQYLLIPFILIFGMAEWVIRLPAALAGTATVAVTYYLGKEAYDRRVGWIASALLAVSPWHVIFSRWANQGILLPLTLSLAVLFLLKGRGPKVKSELVIPTGGYRFKPFLISAIFISLALFTYAPAKAFLPLFVIVTILLYWRDFFAIIPGQRWPYFYKYIGLIFLFSLPMVYYTFFESHLSRVRYDAISIFHNTNGFREVVLVFLRNYFSHWSWSYIVSQGDANLRHSPLYVGQLLKPEAVMVVAGVYGLIRRHQREDLLLLAWFLLGPLPASLTNEGIPHSLRSIAILPSVQLIAAIGCVRLYEYFHYRQLRGVFQSRTPIRILVTALVAAFAIFALVFLMNLFVYYPGDSAMWWEYGYRDVIQYCEDHRQEEDVVFSRWAPFAKYHVLYISGYDLSVYQKDHKIPGYRFLGEEKDRNLRDYMSQESRLFVLTPMDTVFYQPIHEVASPRGELVWVVIRYPVSPLRK